MPAAFRAADIEDFARTYPFAYAEEELSDLACFLAPLYIRIPRLDRWAATFLREDGSADTYQLLVDMTQTIEQTFKHVARHEKGVQEPARTLESPAGAVATLRCS